MSYNYIRSYYGIDVPVGHIVQHEVTGRFGTIRPEGRENQHYVRVQFEGDKFCLPCHPRELVFDPVGVRAGVR